MQPDLNILEIKAACCKFICELEPDGNGEFGKGGQRMRVGGEGRYGLGKKPGASVCMRKAPQIAFTFKNTKVIVASLKCSTIFSNKRGPKPAALTRSCGEAQRLADWGLGDKCRGTCVHKTLYMSPLYYDLIYV